MPNGPASQDAWADADPRPAATSATDRQALFFVVRNPINNSLEAMQGKGRLALSYGGLGQALPSRLRELLGGGRKIRLDGNGD